MLTTLHSEITPILDCATLLSSATCAFSVRLVCTPIHFPIVKCLCHSRRPVEIPAPITIPLWQSEPAEYAALIPKGPGVYAFRSGKAIVHLSWSAHLNTRVVRLLSRTNSANSNLGSRMREARFVLHCWPTTSKLESSLVMYEVLRSEGLADYRKRLRLRHHGS